MWSEVQHLGITGQISKNFSKPTPLSETVFQSVLLDFLWKILKYIGILRVIFQHYNRILNKITTFDFLDRILYLFVSFCMPHTPANEMRNQGCLINNFVVYGVVRRVVQTVADKLI